MRTTVGLGILAVLALAPAAGAQTAAAPTHILIQPGGVVWGDPPPVLPKGASFAVLSGDPGQPGPFTLRLKMPAGYTIAPHWHPTDEQVTVISGTFSLGMGDTIDAAKMQDLGAGGYALMPSPMHHYARAKTAAIVQVHGIGPFALNYVNPADDPSKAAPAK